MAIVIPFTGSLERKGLAHTCLIDPSPTNGLEKESIALIFQITTVDKKRLIKKLGTLDSNDVEALGALLKDMLRI